MIEVVFEEEPEVFLGRSRFDPGTGKPKDDPHAHRDHKRVAPDAAGKTREWRSRRARSETT